MKRSLCGLIFICLGSIAAAAQGSTTIRPRVVPAATPPRILNDKGPSTTPGGPPVLKGGDNTTGTAQPQPTQPPIDDDDAVIKVETNLVTMPVSVLDRDGRFISGLQQRDFKIFEDGVEQKVDYFQSVEQPFTVVLLIDVSPSTRFKIDEIQQAAITFINQLRPADRVMVISFDQEIHVLSQPTNNRYQLASAIRQAEFGDGTSLYDAVDFVIGQELRQIQGRKAVVMFTDGVDTTSRDASYQSTLNDTEEVDALFYPIRYDTSADQGGGYPVPQRRRMGRPSWGDILSGVLGGGVTYGGMASPEEYELGRKYLESLAQNSGGRKFEAQSIYNIDAAFSGIAEELRRQYSLGYYPEKVGTTGERRQIKIRVMKPGVVVHTKNSYIVGQTNRTLAGK